MFLEYLQHKGADKEFRIGTSMAKLIFSRSVGHGLRADQKQLTVEAYGNGSFDIRFYDFSIPGGRIKIYDEFRCTDLIGNKRLFPT